MARFAVLYTLHMTARDKRHIVEAWIEDVPDGMKAAEVVEALQSSKYLAEFSERGVFMGNRRVLSDATLPKEYTATDARHIPWEELVAVGKGKAVQLNVRVSAAERAAFMAAAERSGSVFAEWVREALREKAGLTGKEG